MVIDAVLLVIPCESALAARDSRSSLWRFGLRAKGLKMSKRLRSIGLAVLLMAGIQATAVITAPVASADTVICDQFGSTSIQSGRYIVQNNRWGSTAPQCINVTATGFSITQQDGNKATNGAPNSYPSAYYGCHYGNCSSGTILPVQASSTAFSGISTSVSMSYPGAGIWDAAYDIWFDPTPRTDGQNTGAEVMVWLNHQGSIQPVGSQVGTANLGGATWAVWEGNIGWNVVSYVRTSATGSINFPVSTFFNDAVSRGFAQRSWYLTSVQAGFEPWQNGVGLAVNNFSVTTSGGGGGTTTTSGGGGGTTTSTTSGGGRSCTVTWAVQSQWQDGFVANLTIRNNGGSAINGWTLTWTFPGNQRIVNAWNIAATQSGASVTARDAGSNAQIPVNGSTTAGFQATYSGTNGTPSPVQCAAT
jgi:hypothetical protein